MNIVRMIDQLKWAQDTYGFVDIFDWYVTAHRWTSLAADSGATVTVGTVVGGDVVLTPGTTDNNEVGIYLTNSLYKPANGKPLYCEALTQFTEANTSAANVFFGLCSSPGANILVDDGAGPRTSGTFIGLYKVDGGTVWRFQSRNGSTYTDQVSTTTAGGTTAQRLGIEIVDGLSTSMTVVPTVDGLHLRDSTTNAIIRQQLDTTSISAAALMLYMKQGSTSADILHAAYAGIVAAR